MTNKRDQFIQEVYPKHLKAFQEQYPDASEQALAFWVTDASEKEWRVGRVYEQPAEVEITEINVYDPTASFTSGKAEGLHLRFNPGGPMVSITNMSFAEGKELALALITALKAVDCWTAEDEAEIYDEPLERAVEPSPADPLA